MYVKVYVDAESMCIKCMYVYVCTYVWIFVGVCTRFARAYNYFLNMEEYLYVLKALITKSI